MIEAYLSSAQIDVETACRLTLYLSHIRARANGSIATNANWIRRVVRSHPSYQRDSVVTEDIANDLVKKSIEIGEANVPVCEVPYRVGPDGEEWVPMGIPKTKCC